MMLRHFSRTFAFALSLAACGCGGDSRKSLAPDSGTNLVPDAPAPVTGDADLGGPIPATPDAGPDGLAADANDDDAADALGACGVGLSGAAPFGKALSGTGTFVPTYAPSSGRGAPVTATMTAYIYFPAGRVAGAPVQLAVQSRVVTTQYFFGPPVSLASDLSAKGLSVAGHDMELTGDLLPGDGGLQATIDANFSSPATDVADDRKASLLMCPTGDVPAPTLQVTGGDVSPLSQLGLYASAPLSPEALSALRITSPLGPVALKVSAASNGRFSGGPNYGVTPASSAFPPGQPLTFDASAVKDVLGRNVSFSTSTTQILATTAVLDNLSLTTAPPTGAMACTGCSASLFPGVDGGSMLRCTGGGKLSNGVLGVGSLGPNTGGPVIAMLALPSTSLTKLRVRMAVGDVVEGGSSCRNGPYSAVMSSGTMAVVGPNGETSAPVSLTCEGAMVDRVLDLPNVSPLWLVVHIQASPSLPFFMPTPGPPSISIDELQFM